MAIEVVPAGPYAGAELRGIDFSRPLGDSDFVALLGALSEHAMVFVRGAQLSYERQRELTRRFGNPMCISDSTLNVPGFPELSRISNILESGRPIGLVEAGHYWHTDRSWHQVPQGYALLHAIEIPNDDSGNPLGDTMFVSTAHAFETLPPGLQERISGMRAVHYFNNPRKKAFTELRDKIPITEHQKPPVSHPVVRTHPVSGRKCLYVNQQYTMAIEGLGQKESTDLIDFLCGHIIREEVRYRHRWQIGDLVIWDDCVNQHFAIPDYQLPRRRLLIRSSVEGAVPA
jgi:taurine dioxygenase